MRLTMRILAAGALSMVATSHPALAASCSCAAVPLLNSMETGSPDGGNWFLSSSYEFHEISDLVSGTQDVNDETDRQRQSQALVVEASYGINDRFSVSALVSAVEHKRTVGRSGTSVGRGIGDGMVMLRYTPRRVGLFERTGITFGIGTRIPIGDDDAVDFVTLAEDMQPSTGAWGALLWAQANHSFSAAAKGQIFGSLSYTANGENDRDYQFGNSWILALGGTYQTDTPWGLGAEMRYRNADRDQRNSVLIPNTGGEWLDFVPAIQYHFSNNIAGKLSGRIPVWRDLNDALQFTTSYSIAMSISYVFSRSE
ncbi:MAG: hypothetical protein O7H39_06350 [Gammaproteobacteria bacterium]|nr:hypothetical protein [Gammaproteobacteria bacterium]